MNDKISEKAVWDELVPSEDEKTSSASFGQSAQAQMMFCYKCNQVIPANSAFCPWCQTELFVTCPKCGNKYSSQYPSCNQCGTNLKVYMLEQERLKEERIKKQRQEEERKRVEEEQRRLAEEQQRRLNVERAKHEEIRSAQLRTRFLNENITIIRTPEFKKVELLIKEYEKYYHNYHREREAKKDIKMLLAWVLLAASVFLFVLVGVLAAYSSGYECMILIPIFVFTAYGCIKCFMWEIEHPSKQSDAIFNDFLNGYSVDNEIKRIIDAASYVMKRWTPLTFFDKKTDFIILSYRKAYYKEFELYTSLMDKYSVK